MTPFNWVLLLLMAFGAVVCRALRPGARRQRNLSDTYPWGLWILFDLVWIAVAAGAFAMAGVIYVFQRKDLYGLGRTAVLMGLLSYSFVMVTLIADLGLPWHSYQLALQAPEHSAMFEVSWCVGLYVTILLLEFLPVPFAHLDTTRPRRRCGDGTAPTWRGGDAVRLPAVAQPPLRLATAVIFGTLAWIFRARDQKAEPIMLAIAAVTLSTMHQSSLGSLYLLMPNMLAPQWWSPVMPVSFLSSIAAGTALVILIDMWIAKVAPPARDHAARLGRTDHVLGAPRLPRVPPRRHGDPQPVLRSLRRRPRHGLRGRDPPRRRVPLILLARKSLRQRRRALRRVAPRGPRRGVQPHERRALRDDLPGPDALGRTGELRAVDRRVGRFDRPDRRDDLPLRPGGPSDAGSLPGGAQRGH